MQYMLLIYNSPDAEPAVDSPEFHAMLAAFEAFNQQVTADGVLIAGEGLQGIESACSLRVRDGRVETTDGPFAETREHLGGFFLLEVPDLATAKRYAAMIPAAAFGTIEVRPVLDYSQLDA